MKREITEKEILICNAVGVLLSLAIGCIIGGIWIFLGIVGTMIIPVPVILIYVLFRNLMGDGINKVKVTFGPGFTWAGKKYEI